MEKKHHFGCPSLIFNTQRNFEVKNEIYRFRPLLHKRQAVSIDANNSSTTKEYSFFQIVVKMCCLTLSIPWEIHSDTGLYLVVVVEGLNVQFLYHFKAFLMISHQVIGSRHLGYFLKRFCHWTLFIRNWHINLKIYLTDNLMRLDILAIAKCCFIVAGLPEKLQILKLALVEAPISAVCFCTL